MRPSLPLLLGSSLALSLLAVASAPSSAHACGGCVVPPDQDTQVTGHRMILSLSKTQTTLYDQIEYAGNPESFAWFLPIAGEVKIGLSSDAMFAFLGDASQVVIYPPPLQCVSSSFGDQGLATAEDSSDSDGVYVPAEQDVNVIAQEVVGPYETVQLEAKTPGALTMWLESHGYAVPDDVQPIITAYQQEGFGFLAMKLVPGEGVTSMRPVRVTTPGGGLALPLRMVAAGTGAFTPVTLHVVSEGRYEMANRPNLQVPRNLLVWDWEESSSNYRVLRDRMVDNSAGFGWLTESAAPFTKQALVNRATAIINNTPGTTGWGIPEKDITELDDAVADLDTLFAGMSENSTWLTRMYARLSRPALAEDLVLGAARSQEQVPRFLQARAWVGEPPPCNGGGLSCSLPRAPRGDGAAAFLAGTGLLAAFAWARRRRG